MKKIRLFLIEDNRLLRDGLVTILKKQKDIKIAAGSGSIANSADKIRELMPNIILLDLGLRSRNSITVIDTVKKDFPDARVVIMDLAPIQGDVNLFSKAGVSGFILKDATTDDFLATIRAVAEGKNVVPANLEESLFSQIVEHALKDSKDKLKEAVRMTKREREVIILIGEGLSKRAIAQRLQVSTFIVKSLVHNIMEKLVLHTRLEVSDYLYSKVTLNKVIKDLSTVIR